MPLSKSNEIKQLFLPTSKDLPEGDKEWVTIEVGPILGGDILNVAGNTDSSEMMLTMLLKRIKEWNVRDINNDIAPLSTESIKHLSMDDLSFLLSEFMGAEAATGTDPKVITVI